MNESRQSTKTHKKAWINGLLKRGMSPILEILDIVPMGEWKFWEKYWISQIKYWEFSLTNSTRGEESVEDGNIHWNKRTSGLMKPSKTTFRGEYEKKNI